MLFIINKHILRFLFSLSLGILCCLFLTACFGENHEETPNLGVSHPSNQLILPTPTLDNPYPLPTPRWQALRITIQAGDTLKTIAKRYQVGMQQIIQANKIKHPNELSIGQQLIIPPPIADGEAPEVKLIPDSELVYSPANAGFQIASYIQKQNGKLANYQENVDGEELSVIQIISRVARENSINPRILLALLEYYSGWVSSFSLPAKTNSDPLGLSIYGKEGLYQQLSYAANELNRGYYLWKSNGVAFWVLKDGSLIAASPYLNAGTSALHQLFAELENFEQWYQAVSYDGFYATYENCFGNPFQYAIEPLLPHDLDQPPLQLPFEKGVSWYFTGGPHPAWGSGSAWAGLDFAPHLTVLGCTRSDEWIAAAADGLIVYANKGMVLQDLDNDGIWQTGWSLMYFHVESRERVAVGTYLKKGERIGHPSCEGGISNGTHVHIARRYNGEWIPADRELPFVFDDWVSYGKGVAYDGFLIKGEDYVVADDSMGDTNRISH